MHFLRINGRSRGRTARCTISKGAQLSFLLWGLFAISPILLVAGGTMPSFNARLQFG